MSISGPNGKYFPIDNKHILKITIKPKLLRVSEANEFPVSSRKICLHTLKTNYNEFAQS